MWILLSVLLFGLWAAGAYLRWRKKKTFAPALALWWFVFALAPVSNIVPMLYPHGDRFLYGPSLALLVPLAWLVAQIWEKYCGRILGLGVAVLFIVATVVALLPWQSNLTLWQYAVTQAPSAQVARFNLAVTWQHEYGEMGLAEENYLHAIENPSGDFYHSRWAAASARELVKIYLATEDRKKAISLLKNISSDEKFPENLRYDFSEKLQELEK